MSAELGTIGIRGRVYTVERFEGKFEGKLAEDLIRYRLKGKRGAVYETMRNARDPHMMFLIGGGRFGISSSVTSGVWLTDKTGRLAVAAQ